MKKLLLSDDHPLIINGLIHLINLNLADATIDIATTLEQTIFQLEKSSYDLLVLDINIPGGDKISMIEAIRLRSKTMPILVCSSYDEELYAIPYVKAGANGYITKTAPSGELWLAIETVMAGKYYASTAIYQHAFGQLISGSESTTNVSKSLSTRELEVARLLIRGISTTSISQHFNLTPSSISIYKSRIFEKLGVRNVAELATYFSLHSMHA